jgi:hypothetical protein
MGLFNSKEEKERERSLDARVKGWNLFPGNLEEFNQLKGVEHMIMDIDSPQKYVSQQWNNYREMCHRLVEEGCVALIHYVPSQRVTVITEMCVEIGGYGVPVKRTLFNLRHTHV